ncbi:hypothetical protein SAMN04488029_2911 [Reichenbachiella faecimaris]|uniref:Uncharacterized protein n=1 Tax=Reichenbachiella faecimaris TaxID=692418 RepID=A0A1W2GIJ1_REIFA|nr:glycosyltransferase [Reichenbachiella faecimaris]SMD36470.1 hypothetical protein SAMN04488029_2911 [Reichenbachiella faecimaris]
MDLENKISAREILGRIRNLVLFLFVHYKKLRKTKPTKPVIFFELEDNYWHRYLLILCHFFENKGFQIIIMPKLKFMSNWATLALADQLPDVKFQSTTHFELCISSKLKKRKNTKHLFTDYFQPQISSDAFKIPMPMVDTMYKLGYYKKSKALSTQEKRNIKIFYVGNINKGHNTPTILECFNILDRNQIIDIITRNFADSIAKPPGSDIEMLNMKAEIVIFDRKELNIRPEMLLEALANCQFILGPPGVVMPQTHFIVEAMSVGCIPIIEFPEIFDTPLDDSNSVIFDGETDLKEKIKYVLSLPDDRIREMHTNVIQFYDDHLSIDAVVGNILNPRYQSLFLNCENYSVQQMNNVRRD